MKNYLGFFIALIAVASVTSCEKVIELDLQDSEPVVVIEGRVNNNLEFQQVKISRSVQVADQGVFPAVTGAAVVVTDNAGNSFSFQEQSRGTYTRRFRGVPGRTYTLKVTAEGKEYSAVSMMPQQVNLDSLGINTTKFFNETRKSLVVYFPDPSGVRNYYRFLLTVNGIGSRGIFTYNDDFTDGKGVQRELLDFDMDLREGDLAEVEMQCIDAAVYRYWQGVDQNESRGGASTTPANPVSNIKGGALGYFSAHTTQRSSVAVP
jgi:hypothetical protein